MYSRIIPSLFVAGSRILCKYGANECIPQKSLLLPLLRSATNNLKSVSPCSVLRFHSTNPPNYDKIAEKGLEEFLKDPSNEKHYKILQLEVEVMRQNGENVPDTMRTRDWFELVQLNSRSKRRRFLDFLFGIEKKKQRKNEEKKVNRELYEKIKAEKSETEDSDPLNYLQYRLGCNSQFLRFYDTTLNHFYNWRLVRATMFSQKIVMDCGYESKMTRSELKNCARQLMLTFAANRAHDDPFDLHYCNLNPNGDLHRHLHSFIPTMYDSDFPINMTANSYLDCFDKKNLIYLTPDAQTEMQQYDHDAIYIIGGIVDKVTGQPLSLAKAKREGLKMARLPIDKYLHFGGGSGKRLTLNQMISILLDMRQTNNWEHALRHVPCRKLSSSHRKTMENKANKYIEATRDQAKIYSTERIFTHTAAREKFRIK